MLLSVIIPVYNLEKYVAKTVDSVLAQTYSNIEIIIVNDGSTDNTAQICDKYSDDYQSITVIHQNNQGLSSARNSGIAVAKGEYITFIDADDQYGTNETLKDNIQLLIEDKEIDFVQFQLINYNINSGKKLYSAAINNNIIVSNIEELVRMRLTDSITNNACNKIYKASIFEKFKFAEGKLCEDAIFNNDIIVILTKVALTNKGYYRYNIRPNSIMTGKKNIGFYHCYLEYTRELFRRGMQYESMYSEITNRAASLGLLYRDLTPKMFWALAPTIKEILPPMRVICKSSRKEVGIVKLIILLILKINMLIVKSR